MANHLILAIAASVTNKKTPSLFESKGLIDGPYFPPALLGG
jgi:hypothetical protein